MWFKTCPRCDGDLHEDRDLFEYFVSCMQCGYELTDAQVTSLKLGADSRERNTTGVDRPVFLPRSA